MKPNKYLKGRSAIYGIRNLINGKLYIGKTCCMYRRCGQYIYDFKNRRREHLNEYLLAAMTKIGIENFEMFVIEFCDKSLLSENELKWMRHFNTLDKNYGYNLRLDSSSGMYTHADTRAKISENLKAQWASGKRANHGETLKKAWALSSPNRRIEQANRFRKSRTKFEYSIVHPDGAIETGIDYLRLKELNIQGAVGNMSRSGLNETNCNGFRVTKRPLQE